MPARPALEIQLFGPFAVWVHGVPLRHLRTRKGQWLLALLALRHPRPVDRTWLAETLWPDSGEALHNLRQCLADLRAALGSEAGRLISTSGHRLGLNLNGDASVDALEFDAAIRRGDLPSLEAAASQGTRVFLEDCREEWAAEERLSRELAYLSALETLAQAAAAQKEFAVAARYLRQAVTRDPLRESARRALMQSLAAEGSLSAAQQVYRDLRALLRREMNTEPDSETTSLFQRLRAQAAASHAPAASAASCAFLPVSLTQLVGREQELKDITTALSSARLVTLTGAGGIGKTSLALHVAEAVTVNYPDGVWVADLAPLSKGCRIAASVAASVGLPGQSHEEPEAALRRYLSERRGLLIFDNCEHLVAESAALARTLLQSCPRLRLLVTSREPLGVEDETLYRVPSLAVDDAVRLFTERATAAGVGFVLTDANCSAVQTICRRLDGIPLALELAAARIPVLSPAQIAARLDDAFRLLTRGRRTAVPRQQTLKATLDWSYDLLSPPEQTLLARLSVFAGGWTADAAEAVCVGGPVNTEAVLDLLEALAGKSLVVREERTEGVRQRFLEPLRQYAGERLAAEGEEAQTAAEHADYFLAFAERISRASASRGEWLTGMKAEMGNLRAALRRLTDDGDSGEKPLRLVSVLEDYWHTEGLWEEARATLAEVLAHPGSQNRTEARATVLKVAGDTARAQGDYDRAETLIAESLSIWRELEKGEGAAIAAIALGQTARMRGDYAAARSYHEQSLEFFRSAGISYGILNNLFNLSGIASLEGDLNKARALTEECLALARAGNDSHTNALCLYNLGRIAALQQEPARAKPLLEASLALQRQLGSKHEIPTMLTFLAGVLCDLGCIEKAQEALREALTEASQQGDRRIIAGAFDGITALACRQRKWARAALFQSAAEKVRAEIGEPKRVPVVQEQCRTEMNDLRAALGAAEFETAWWLGQMMTLDEAVAQALAELSPKFEMEIRKIGV